MDVGGQRQPQGEKAPEGEYRVVLLGTGAAAASAGARGGTGLEALTRTRTNYYYLGGQRVAMRQGVVGQGRDSVYYLHPDHLGSTSEGTPPTTYNYTGQRLDGTGLLYYGARYYDSLPGGIPLAKPQLDRHPSNSYNPPL